MEQGVLCERSAPILSAYSIKRRKTRSLVRSSKPWTADGEGCSANRQLLKIVRSLSRRWRRS
jgi:hypothetical protein